MKIQLESDRGVKKFLHTQPVCMRETGCIVKSVNLGIKSCREIPCIHQDFRIEVVPA